MEREFEKTYHALENTHWWFRGRRDIIKRIIRGYDKDSRILEVGCSSGRLTEELRRDGYTGVIGVDISLEAMKACRRNGVSETLQMDALRLGFKDDTFDLIIASDLLEHVENDLEAVKEWKRVLKRGGTAVVFVPAYRSMWSDHDRVNQHYRRYGRREYLTLFEKGGFEIERVSHWNFTLFFPVFAARVLKKKTFRAAESRADLYRMNEIANRFLLMILLGENRYCSRRNLPAGLSLFLIARKLK